MILHVIAIVCYAVLLITAVFLYERAMRYKRNWASSDSVSSKRYERILYLQDKLSSCEDKLSSCEDKLAKYQVSDILERKRKPIRNVSEFKKSLLDLIYELEKTQGTELTSLNASTGEFGGICSIKVEF